MSILAIRVLLLSVALAGIAAPASAALRLYNGSWIAESFGNDVVGGTEESEFFSVFGIPMGNNCNPYAPVCPVTSTPVVNAQEKNPEFNPLGPDCVPYTQFGPSRPAKGASTPGVPPLYRNPVHFTSLGAPKTTSCTAYSTVAGAVFSTTHVPGSTTNTFCVSGCATAPLTTNDPLRGIVMKGAPVAGSGLVSTTAPGKGKAFTLAAAPPAPGSPLAGGMFRTTQGSFNNIFPYLYSYTYATLRNDAGSFKANGGFFTTGTGTGASVSFPYTTGGVTQANVVVKSGLNRFGGVMKLLGQITTKVCFYTNNGCSLGGQDWKYQSIGASGYKAGGVLTAPFVTSTIFTYYNTGLQQTSMVTALASRFPWTTGTVTLTATGRGPHRTIEKRVGYDGRTTLGKGTVQLVSPVLTHWLGPTQFDTGGIAILRIQLPEPGKWASLAAGLLLLGVVYRFRAR